jgi:hypothetical protein
VLDRLDHRAVLQKGYQRVTDQAALLREPTKQLRREGLHPQKIAAAHLPAEVHPAQAHHTPSRVEAHGTLAGGSRSNAPGGHRPRERTQQRGHVDVGKDVAVPDEEGSLWIEERAGVGDAARGTQDARLVEEGGRERPGYRLEGEGEVVSVDEDATDTVSGEVPLDLDEGRSIAHRNQGLGQLVGEGTEAGSKACRQNHRRSHPSSATSAKDMSALSRKDPTKP